MMSRMAKAGFEALVVVVFGGACRAPITTFYDGAPITFSDSALITNVLAEESGWRDSGLLRDGAPDGLWLRYRVVGEVCELKSVEFFVDGKPVGLQIQLEGGRASAWAPHQHVPLGLRVEWDRGSMTACTLELPERGESLRVLGRQYVLQKDGDPVVSGELESSWGTLGNVREVAAERRVVDP